MSFCPKCGAQNHDGNSFCTKCGSPLSAIAPVRPAASTAASVNQTMKTIDAVAAAPDPPVKFALEAVSLVPMGKTTVKVDESFVKGTFPLGRTLFSAGETRTLNIEKINDLGQPLEERRIGEGIKRGFFIFLVAYIVLLLASGGAWPKADEARSVVLAGVALVIALPFALLYWRKSATLRIVPSSGEPLEIEVAWKNRDELIAMRKEIEKRIRASSRRAQMKLTAMATQATIANQRATAQHTEDVMRQGFSDVVDAINNGRSDNQ